MLHIVFPSDDIAQCCYERFELRVGGKLYASGNGQEFEVYDAKQKRDVVRKIENEPSDGLTFGKRLTNEARAFGNNPTWSTVLTLRFLLPGLRSVMGVWSFSTHAEASSIPAIIAAYDMVKQRAGTVVGIPFDLVVEMVKSQKPGTQSRFPVVKLIANLGAEHLENVKKLHGLGMLDHTVLTPKLIESKVIETEARALPAPEVAQ